jgi:hypothetical protein
MIVLSSCSGPEGPPGYDGLDGQDGLVGEVFELKMLTSAITQQMVILPYRALNPKIFCYFCGN